MTKKFFIFILVFLILLIFYFAYNYFTELSDGRWSIDEEQLQGQQKAEGFKGPDTFLPTVKGPNSPPPMD